MIRHFGALIPATNTTVEIEYNRLLPESLQVHTARLGKDSGTPFQPSLDADLEYQSTLLGGARVEAVCLTQTSASLFDDEYDAKANRLMAAGTKAPSVTSAEAVGRAAQAMGTRRIAMVSPYSQTVIERAKRYYETRHDLEVVAMEGFGATDSYAIGTLPADNATDAFSRIDTPDIEALVVLGGNFPTMKFVAGWEDQFHKPVITTNQAALWGVLSLMNIDERPTGLGRLLEQMPKY